MKLFPLFLCSLAFSLGLAGCKGKSATPAETEAAAEPETTAHAAEPAAPTEAAPAATPAPAEPDAPPPSAPVVEVDPNAPSDVAGPPADAKRSDSGLAWKRLKKGKGEGRPGKFDTVTMSYTGWTPDGRQFDSSARHGGPVSVVTSRLTYGLSEGLKMMTPGEKRRFWIPGKLSYGEVGDAEQASPLQPLGPVVFDVELVSFEKSPTPPAAPKDVGAIPADAETSESGLAWRVLKKGVGTEHPKDTAVVSMTYTVWTADGEVVESSALRDGVDTVGISRLVPGWNEGMKLMVEGERRLFWIREDLAFQGQPYRPKGMLVVDVELINIRDDMHQVR